MAKKTTAPTPLPPDDIADGTVHLLCYKGGRPFRFVWDAHAYFWRLLIAPSQCWEPGELTNWEYIGRVDDAATSGTLNGPT